MSIRPFQAWLSERADAYLYVVTALCLNVPFVSLVLARHLESVRYTGLTGVYLGLVFLGYYALSLFLLVTSVFVVFLFSRRLAVAASAVLLAAALFYLVVNSIVHGIFRIHVNAFWLEYVLTSWDGLGVPASVVATGLVVMVAIVVLEWGLFRLARRLIRRRALATGFVGSAVAALLISQVMHIVAHARNDARITVITPQLPFYFPMTSHRHAVTYGPLVPMVAEPPESSSPDGSASLWYPLREVPCPAAVRRRPPNILMLILESWRFDMMDELVSPKIHALSRQSSLFLTHFSSGNATPTGIFGLFYGIHPTYWTAVKANSEVIDNPVLIDLLKAHDYALGIYADSKFGRHKIKDTIFRGIDVHESFAGGTADVRDRDMTAQLLAFIAQRRREGRPFLGFAFYKSTHYSYYYPEETARFRPFATLNLALAGHQRTPTLYLNDYRNAISHVDGLVGEIVDRLAQWGLLEDTIIVVTSDHGEEFNDNEADYWGHGGNFTEYQTRVPLVLYVPGRTPRQVAQVTTHVDVPTTLVQEALRCGADARDYSNGRNLFGPLTEARPLVIGSYVNHALVLGDDVYVVYPFYVQKHKLSNIKADAGVPRADLVRRAMEEMHRFYRPRGGQPETAEAAQ